MGNNLMLTKLYIPQTRPSLVPRQRLVDRLNQGLLGQEGRFARKLTLVTAPAGSGKSTLAARWLALTQEQDPPPRVAWLTVDENDNDPAQFGRYLRRAFQGVEAIPAAEQETSAEPDEPDPDGLVTNLLNEAAAAGAPMILALDDYQSLENPAIHQMVTLLIERQPPLLHTVLISRQEPPLPLSRWRARHQMTQVGPEALRFTRAEAWQFLNQVMGLALSGEAAGLLSQRAEGWIAGLQLAALSLKQHPHPDKFIANFGGGSRYIFDYLAEEVLRQQPEEIRQFLLETSILTRLSAPLCDAVRGVPETAGRRGSQAILEQLEAANLFIAALDDQRQWFRYHQLFAEFLQTRCRQTAPGLLPRLHQRAARYYQAHGRLEQAVEHALAGEDMEQAGDMVETAAREMLMRSQILTLMGWIDALPPEIVERRPGLNLAHAMALLAGGRLREAERCLRQAESRDKENALLGEITAARALLAIFHADVAGMAALARQALDHLPGDDPFLRDILALGLAMPHILDGQLTGPLQVLSRAAVASQKAGNRLVSALILCQLAELQLAHGQLKEAAATYRRAARIALLPDGRPAPLASMAYAGLGMTLRHQNRLEEAAQQLEAAIDMDAGWESLASGALDGYLALALVKHSMGQPDQALAILDRAEAFARRLDSLVLDDIIVSLCKAQLWLMQGRVAEAAAWAERAGLLDNPGQDSIRYEGSSVPLPYLLAEIQQLFLARLFIARGEPDKALSLLAPRTREAEKSRRFGKQLEMLVLSALAHQQKHENSQALEAVSAALRLAAPEGFMRLFLDEGEPMAALLRRAAAEGVELAFTGRLLDAFAATQEEQPQAGEALVEPLTERESQVLRLIAAGLSNRQIAGELVLARSTVKWHINQLYAKLGVHSRTQAVACARRLSLLP